MTELVEWRGSDGGVLISAKTPKELEVFLIAELTLEWINQPSLAPNSFTPSEAEGPCASREGENGV